MTDLLEIQRQIVAEIGRHSVGSAARFKLMDAADKVSLAIEAIDRESANDPKPDQPAEGKRA